ncbi:ATP-binding protein [bacterium]|nr:ATP-binding protein [bacterium]
MNNNHLVLISGKSSSGKSASLMSMDNPEGVMYLNCENGKKLPFKTKFKELIVVDPMQVYQAFEEAEKMPDVHTIVIDTLTYLMDMYESTKVLNATNTMQAWGQYAQFMKQMMSQTVAKSTKNVVFLAHTSDVLNEAEMINETLVKVKGSLMNQGIESFFTTVISTKKLPLTKLDDKVAKSSSYTVTAEDKALGFKYVYQTRLTKETVNERIRAPMGMWDMKETYIDNNLQNVINRLHEYYK